MGGLGLEFLKKNCNGRKALHFVVWRIFANIKTH
jgi:hypothetical protein